MYIIRKLTEPLSAIDSSIGPFATFCEYVDEPWFAHVKDEAAGRTFLPPPPAAVSVMLLPETVKVTLALFWRFGLDTDEPLTETEPPPPPTAAVVIVVLSANSNMVSFSVPE